MYDFIFGTPEAIDTDPWRWLLTIKRMLPRWINGIPDSEFRGMYDLLMDVEKDGKAPSGGEAVLMETGSGASTILLLYFALRWDTQLYSWDISSNKLSYLRGLLTDTLFRHYRDRNIYNHWVYTAYNSTSEHVGIPVLGEMDKQVIACFFDSDHTWKTLGAEVSATCPLLADGALVAIDDGNYRYQVHNTAYINMLRAKLGLSPVTISNNEDKTFWEMTEAVLKENLGRVVNQEGGTYRTSYTEDVFFEYYLERKATAEMEMEKVKELDHRFDAWRVYYE